MKSLDHPARATSWLAVGLALVTAGLYLPSVFHDFIQYDDQQYVTENPRVQAGLTWAGLRWAFGFHAGNWHPLAWLSHMLDCQLYGSVAGGHHLTSVLLHAATTGLLYLALQQLIGARWRSAAVAALFGWHPLHVESVAWVAERKDVLCAFFWVLTLLAYGRYAGESKVQSPRSRIFYMLSLLAFALACMSKPMAVTLPFVLLLLDYWPLARLPWGRRGIVLEKLPFFVMSALTCWLTLRAQQEAIVPTAGLSLGQRAAHVTVAYAHYLAAMCWPLNLGVYYPYVASPPAESVLAAAGVLLGLTGLAVRWGQRRPWFLVGWLWYLGTLVPVVGLVQVGDQAWADRYTYLPLTGIFLAGAWLAAEQVTRRRLRLALGTGVAVGLLCLTSRQLRYWQDTHTLFEHTNQVTRNNYLALTVLGSQEAQAGNLPAALADYQAALQLKPTFPEAHFFLGNALEQQGKLDEAVAEYEQALWFKPLQEQTHVFLGMVLARQHKYDEAMGHYTIALQLNPDSAVTHNNLARILHTQGRLEEAAGHYRAALAINPQLALARNNLGILLVQQGRVAEGAEELRRAAGLNPTNTETLFNLAQADAQLGQWPAAVDWFAKSVGPNTSDPRAHLEFARALGHVGRTREAEAQYAAALLGQPDEPAALDGLAWLLATSPGAGLRNGTQAVPLAERACVLTDRRDPLKLKTLAAALAETGRFAEALTTAREALNQLQPAPAEAAELEKMIAEFQQSRPWRSDQ